MRHNGRVSPISKPRKKSSNSRKPARRSGRSIRPEQLRLPGLREVYRAYCDAGPDFAALPNTLEAELWISTHLGVLQEQSPDQESLLLALLDLVDELERTGQPEAYAMLHGLSAIGPAALREPAASAAARMSAAAAHLSRLWPQPHWLDLLGQATPGDCWHTTDRYGELEQILCTFVHRDGDRPHGILIERDHCWHGAAIAITVVDDIQACHAHLAKASRKDGSELLPLAPTAAAGALKNAFTAFLAHGVASPARPDIRADEELFNNFNFAVARGLHLGPEATGGDEQPPLTEVWDEAARAALAQEYLASPAGTALNTSIKQLAPKMLIRLSVEVLGRDPRRIGPGTLTRIFTDALPGHLLLPDALLEKLPDAVAGYYIWLAEQHLPKADRKAVLRTLRLRTAALPQTLAAFPQPLRAYIADIRQDGHDGDVLQAVIDRRGFAIPQPGHRWAPADTDPHDVDHLDPADEEERALLVQEEMRARKVPQRLRPVHEVLANQLWLNDPVQLWPAAQRLRDTGLSREQVLDRLADVLSEHLTKVLRAAPDHVPDLQHYTQALDALAPRA
jgi:hypothetical protein